MNRTNVQRTIDYLRALPTRQDLPQFDMSDWFRLNGQTIYLTSLKIQPELVNECGTTACLAGHIVIGFRDEIHEDATHFWSAGQQFLGLDEEEADYLFFGKFAGGQLKEITLDQAIAELERMLAA